MLTTDDIGTIPIFSTLAPAELERLARISADIQLNPGEFAVHEGGERALFAVLSGKIEVIKTFDGVERRLGWRNPGAIFGEVPIALGTVFPGGYRAAEPSRVMRIDVQEYYAIASTSKDFSEKVSALARERLGGLQSLAAEPNKPRVTLIGHRRDAACGTLRRFLARNQISFNWLAPDAPELSTLWSGPRPPDSDGPVLLLADGQVVAQPNVRDVANRLGLQTSARSDEYDVAIIGGGQLVLPRQSMGRQRGCKRSLLSVRRRAGRLALRRGSRTTSDSRTVSPGTNLPRGSG
jgi:thioredoxin reductase (NADPH)